MGPQPGDCWCQHLNQAPPLAAAKSRRGRPSWGPDAPPCAAPTARQPAAGSSEGQSVSHSQPAPRLDIVVVVAQRVLHALIHVLAPRKVDHAVKPGMGGGRAGREGLQAGGGGQKQMRCNRKQPQPPCNHPSAARAQPAPPSGALLRCKRLLQVLQVAQVALQARNTGGTGRGWEAVRGRRRRRRRRPPRRRPTLMNFMLGALSPASSTMRS